MISFRTYFSTTPTWNKVNRSISYTHLSLTINEPFDLESVSEGVDYVLLSINLLKLDVTSIHDLTYKVIAMQNMLGALVWLCSFRLSYGSSAVIIQQNRSINREYNSKLSDELPQSHHFFCSIRCSNIFCFAYKIGYSMLLEIFLAYRSSIQGKYVARYASTVIIVWLKIEINISHKFQVSVPIDKLLVLTIS